MSIEFQVNHADGFGQIDPLCEESVTIVEKGEGFNDVPYLGVKPPPTDPDMIEEKNLLK
jgi:hypothetical protein